MWPVATESNHRNRYALDAKPARPNAHVDFDGLKLGYAAHPRIGGGSPKHPPADPPIGRLV